LAGKAGLGPNVKNHRGRRTVIQALANNDFSGDRHNLTIRTQKPSKCDKKKKYVKYLLANRIYMFFPDNVKLNYLVALEVA